MNKTYKVVVKNLSREIPKDDLEFLKKLPEEIRYGLLEQLRQSPRRKSVVEYFRELSKISRLLMVNPGTYKMLEIVYTGNGIEGFIDEYFVNSLAGRALKNRLEAVISHVVDQMHRIVAQNGHIKIVNLGSGSGRDTIEALKRNSHLLSSVSVDCIDIDPEALMTARRLTKEKGFIKNFKFSQKSLTQLHYRKEIDLGLMIGILCGLEFKGCVAALKKVKPYFKSGGILVASNVLKNMVEEDPLMAYIMENVMGWRLVYKTSEQLRDIFEKAGYEWQGIFYDEPTRFHGMGVARVV